MFLGSLFRAIPRSVAKVRMKLPCRRQHRLRGFRASKKRWISTLFSEGVRGSSGIAFFFAFDDFGCLLGTKMESILELASALFEPRNFDDFLSVRLCDECKGRRQGRCRSEAFLTLLALANSAVIPSRPAAPEGLRRILRTTPSAAGPLSTGNW